MLVDECTFLTPKHLSQMDLFNQIVMVGDPCQLGVPLAAEFVYDFMSRIKAFFKSDGVVYRTRNPEIFQLLNYIGYEGRFSAVNSTPELQKFTFQIVNCKQHRLSRAVAIVLACLSYATRNQSILVATQDIDLHNIVNSIIHDDVEFSILRNERCKFSMLHTLQGKQADVLVFDPSELDSYISEPYTAARYLTMILGRATSSFCLITPERKITSSVEELRPFSIMFSGCCQYQPLS